MTSSELLTYIFPDIRLPLAQRFEDWLQESPRFRIFAHTYRDKIRKKVRVASDPEGLADLQAELSTAYWLVLERRFEVEYEQYGTGKQRGPDFSVTYKTRVRFDVEVTRLRGADAGPAAEPGKLANTLCAKLPQLQPSMINMLVLAAGGVRSEAAGQIDLESGLHKALTLLHDRAAHRDDEFFSRRGYLGAREFVRHFSRLSAIRLAVGDTAPILVLISQARHPLPPDLANILGR